MGDSLSYHDTRKHEKMKPGHTSYRYNSYQFSSLIRHICFPEKRDNWKGNCRCTRKWQYSKEKTFSTVRLKHFATIMRRKNFLDKLPHPDSESIAQMIWEARKISTAFYKNSFHPRKFVDCVAVCMWVESHAFCSFPQGDQVFEEMTLNNGNLWQVKWSIY